MGGCAVFTAYGATAHAAEIRPGDSIAVIGIGGVGCSCLQIARAFGASDIIAVDVQDDKLQNALTLGATHIVNAAKENAVDRIRGHDDLCEDFFAYNRAKGTLYDGETRLFLRHDDSPVYMYSMGGCAVFTAYGATAHAAEIRPGDSIAVIGIGGVGCSCLQIARAFGASDIIAVDVQDDKLQNALTLGATHIVNAAKENAVDRIRVGWCVDVAVEALGKPQTFMQCTLSVKDGGKAVMIGLSQAGSVGEIDINRLVKRKIKVIGSYGGRARQDLPEVVKLAESGIQV
ncbi:hypothetical protein Bca52824_019936 [Brassica carinata]|uniref:Alcohol dehydrogenase-like C-terminal domain-containing protein n=1 Tax=Brassica carinata TaxID=52824 RepID=A0A8X7VSB7_BRACI|nr:hypothetical protein Bca52824_019936 [Brassica carinata]